VETLLLASSRSSCRRLVMNSPLGHHAPSQLRRYVTPSRKSPCSADTPVRVPIPPG
jgi:hypothetical protein